MACYVIFAGSSDIGQTVTRLAKEAGHDVFVTARDTARITPDACVDLTDFAAVDAALVDARAKLGHIDAVVNCAGSLWLKPAHMTREQDLAAVLDASLVTSFAVVAAAARQMPQGGAVCLIASAAALTGLANHEAIAAAKAGVIGLALSAAATYAVQGLRVNAVAPGLVDTRLTASLTGSELARKVSAQMHPLGRIGEPDDIARAILFLCDPANAWITGQVLAIDGGLSAVRSKIKV